MKKIISLIMLLIIVMLTGCQKQVSEFDRIMSEYSFYSNGYEVDTSLDVPLDTRFNRNIYIDEKAEKEIQCRLFGTEYTFAYRYTERDFYSGIHKKKYAVNGDSLSHIYIDNDTNMISGIDEIPFDASILKTEQDVHNFTQEFLYEYVDKNIDLSEYENASSPNLDIESREFQFYAKYIKTVKDYTIEQINFSFYETPDHEDDLVSLSISEHLDEKTINMLNEKLPDNETLKKEVTIFLQEKTKHIIGIEYDAVEVKGGTVFKNGDNYYLRFFAYFGVKDGPRDSIIIAKLIK